MCVGSVGSGSAVVSGKEGVPDASLPRYRPRPKRLRFQQRKRRDTTTGNRTKDLGTRGRRYCPGSIL